MRGLSGGGEDHDADGMQTFFRRHAVPEDRRSRVELFVEFAGKSVLVVLLALMCGYTLALAFGGTADRAARNCEAAAAERGIDVEGYSIRGLRWAPGWRCTFDAPTESPVGTASSPARSHEPGIVIEQSNWLALGIHLATSAGAVAVLCAALGRGPFTLVVGGGTLVYGLLFLLAVQHGMSLGVLVAAAGMGLGLGGIVAKWRGGEVRGQQYQR